MTDTAIEAADLALAYGRRREPALRGCSFRLAAGRVCAVVGPNGAGKSTVLKIMAGLDQPSNGDAFLSPGYTVGILEQEPQLDESKDVLGNVEEGMGAIKAKVDRFNEIAEQMATDYSDDLMTEMGKLQEEIDHADAWDLDSQLEQAMDALRCPPPDADVSVLSGGERNRHVGPFLDDIHHPERSLSFWYYNTSKRGITLNLKQARARELVRQHGHLHGVTRAQSLYVLTGSALTASIGLVDNPPPTQTSKPGPCSGWTAPMNAPSPRNCTCRRTSSAR